MLPLTGSILYTYRVRLQAQIEVMSSVRSTAVTSDATLNERTREPVVVVTYTIRNAPAAWYRYPPDSARPPILVVAGDGHDVIIEAVPANAIPPHSVNKIKRFILTSFYVTSLVRFTYETFIFYFDQTA